MAAQAILNTLVDTIQRGEVGELKRLLAVHPKTSTLLRNHRDFNGHVPLHLAIVNGHWDMVEFLLEVSIFWR